MSGNHSEASGDTRVKIAAGTSPAISRSIAFVCPWLSWTSTAPAAAIAVRIDVPVSDCWHSIATSLPVRSDTDLISGRAIIRATRSSVLFVGTDAVGSVSLGGRASIRPDASALLASFAPRGRTCSRHALRERCRGVTFCYWDRRRRPWETKPRSLPAAYRTWQRHYPRGPAVPAMNEARAG